MPNCGGAVLNANMIYALHVAHQTLGINFFSDYAQCSAFYFCNGQLMKREAKMENYMIVESVKGKNYAKRPLELR